MAYNNAIPNPTDRLKDSQSQLKDNFAAIFSVLGVNHADFNTANQGMHNHVTFTDFAGTPTTGPASAIQLYNNLSAETGLQELTFRRNPAGAGIEMTARNGTTNGWTRLPSGILLKWGQSPMPSGGSNASSNPAQTVTYPTGGGEPVFSAVYQVLLSQIYTVGSGTSLGSNGFGIYTSTTTNFSVTWSGNNASNAVLSYLAIGI